MLGLYNNIISMKITLAYIARGQNHIYPSVARKKYLNYNVNREG